jgi:hypothetical protein
MRRDSSYILNYFNIDYAYIEIVDYKEGYFLFSDYEYHLKFMIPPQKCVFEGYDIWCANDKHLIEIYGKDWKKEKNNKFIYYFSDFFDKILPKTFFIHTCALLGYGEV